jgi:hypothetical protein
MVSHRPVKRDDRGLTSERWHVLTAVGVYCYIDLVEELRERRLSNISAPGGVKKEI